MSGATVSLAEYRRLERRYESLAGAAAVLLALLLVLGCGLLAAAWGALERRNQERAPRPALEQPAEIRAAGSARRAV